MIQKVMSVGMLESNCYILGDEASREAVVIDPGGDGPDILAVIQKENLKLKTIINTHGHFDHIGANQALKEATGAPIAIHTADAGMLSQPSAEALFFTGGRLQPSQAEILLQEDDVLEFGTVSVKSAPYPRSHRGGHLPGSAKRTHCLCGRYVICRFHRSDRFPGRFFRRSDRLGANEDFHFRRPLRGDAGPWSGHDRRPGAAV